MENSIKYANAMAEVLHYLKGIRQEDIDKIPNKLIDFFNDNASKDYECQFDYTKHLNELELQEETKGLIAMLCLNYWCETEEQKNNFINRLNDNEKKYQEELSRKYNPENIFKNRNTSTTEFTETAMIKYKESIFVKIKNWLKNVIRDFFCKINKNMVK